MAFSLALARHRFAAARAQSRQTLAEAAPRPDGRILWVHLSEDAAPDGVLLLLDMLQDGQSDLTIIASGPFEPHRTLDLLLDAPADTASGTRAFLDHFAPDLILWVGGEPAPVLWSRALERGIPIVGVEVDPAAHPVALVRSMERFAFLLLRRRDGRLSCERRMIGQLNTVPPPPRVAALELQEAATALASRRLWLAARVVPAEIDDMLLAQTSASRLAHRLLLILDIGEELEADELAKDLRARGWNVALRADPQDPGGETQILIVDDPEEIGLWVRLAFTTFLGGTLRGDGPRLDPLVPASLGSVVLHGPERGEERTILAQLGAARADCEVPDATALGDAVERFLAPDMAADVASAAWNVTSDGAEASNAVLKVLDQILTDLETR
ncbi:3-deoxy-D-manno-octulosonic-acid transferase [Palleronia aestuarii]|uniref:3-deoxy-D-manno-octulosonic acid transferase n=1 Tax=Palleronia aestuarii TaxID=568105 RepID=A0A2W7N8M1_9RHOB|nr:hypothetical protein [Palleronia aestuarii]PZX16531.1 3-deoxy-D-manno-octulosonic-acid transferase [Palleronia aestuarii]